MNLRKLLPGRLSRHVHARPLAPADRLWRRGIGAAAAAVLVSGALVAQGGVTTNASWNDAEWVHSPAVKTVDCANPAGAFATRGEGRALSGSLLGVNLDQVAEASGVLVTNSGARDLHTPAGAVAAPSAPAWADPLNVGLLGDAINIDLGSGLLQLPLNNQTGVLGQYAQATTGGVAQGAAGFINSSGGIATAPGSGYPGLATVSLKQLISQVDPATAATLANVADLSLEVGAVTGRATLDGCDAAWNGVSEIRTELIDGIETEVGNLSRDYLATSTDLTLSSPTITALHTQTLELINDLQPTVNALVSDSGLINSITGPLVTTLTNVLADPNGSGRLSIDGTEATITATVDTSNLMRLVSTPVTDSQGIVSIDLASGGVDIDLVALFGVARSDIAGYGLNELPPNTNLLSDPAVLSTLTTVTNTLISDWLNVLESRLSATVDAIDLVVDLKVELSANVAGIWVEIGAIEATVTGTLLELLNNQGTVSAELQLLSGLADLPVVGTTVVALLNELLKPVLDLLVLTVKTTLGGVVGTALTGVFDILKIVPADITNAANVVLSTISQLYNTLFLPSVLAITVNAQNAPFTGDPQDAPTDWNALPDGRYDVAALRIGILEGLADGVVLYLGRGSVGPACAASQTAQPTSACYGF